MGYQFVTLQSFARKPDQAGRSVAWVLDEAERRPGACLHVAQPAPPEVLHGLGLAEVRQRHDDACGSARVTLPNGRSRAIRIDQKSLLTVVASHPVTMDQARADPAIAADVRTWENRTVAWLRAQYGDGVLSVIRHVDESHPHIHAYILPPDLRATSLHPGASAKRAIVAAGPSEGEDAKSLNKRGDQAYRQALRAWQDSYHQHVGIPCGLARLGPKRRRLTRAEWHAERTAAKAAKIAIDRAAKIDAQGREFVTKTKLAAATVITAAQEKVDAAERQAAAATALEAAAEIREQRAAVALAHADRQATDAKALRDAAESRERKAAAILARAGCEAKRIVAQATSQASRISSWGGRVRAFIDGLRKSSVMEAARRAAAQALEHERARADDAARRALKEAERRREAERRARVVTESALATARERDRARQELAALRPAAPEAGMGRRLGR